MKQPVLYIVIPCFNEEETLPDTIKQIKNKLMQLLQQQRIAENSNILCVDDGSKDSTWELIQKLNEEENINGLKLSRNFGHQNALLAGLLTARQDADVIISIDADLQDDIEVIDQMVLLYQDGADIVYGVRSSRKSDSYFKRTTARLYYWIFDKLTGNMIKNHADFRLISSRVLASLDCFTEVNLYLRGLVTLVGFRSETVEYDRKKREKGESKYSVTKMFHLALDGITSFSVAPIHMITKLGTFIFLVSLIMLIYSVIRHMQGETVIGWTSLMISIWALGGLQLIAIGIIGEYIAKTYMETKHRPRYIVEEYLKK